MDIKDMKKGQCMKFKFPSGEVKGYFYTGITDKRYGTTYYKFCEMVSSVDEIGWNSFWGLSERYIKEKVESGEMKFVNKFCELAEEM